MTEKINCANPKDNHDLKLIRNNMLLTMIAIAACYEFEVLKW